MSDFKKLSKNARIFVEADKNEDASYRWLEKKTKDEVLIFNAVEDPIEIKGDICHDISYEETSGKQTFHFEACTHAENMKTRPSVEMKFVPRLNDWTKYNRLSLWVYPKAIGYTNFYTHLSINSKETFTDAPSLTPNEWNHVVLEIGGYNRSLVNSITLTVFLFGCPPEGIPTLDFYFDKITLENVVEDYDNGWDLDERFAYSHPGYYPLSKKIIVTGLSNDSKFYIYNKDGQIAYSGDTVEVKNDLGNYLVCDFSSFDKIGSYVLKVGNKETKEFDIKNNPYEESIWKSISFLRTLRCGEDIDHVHSACHLNCKTVHPITGATVPNFGGWHDAGDVSQFEICTGEIAHSLLDLAACVKNTNQELYERLLEEAKIGVSWLLRTRFGDGYRALGLTYSVWRDNVLKPDNESVKLAKAENSAFENFISAACLAKAAHTLEADENYLGWCRRSAIEDYAFAKEAYDNDAPATKWGRDNDAQVAGEAVIAAVELYNLTSLDTYLSDARRYARIVMNCQETVGIGKEKLKGFFYEKEDHNYIVCYEHRGHENSIVQGIAMLANVAKNDIDYNKWINCLNLYREYILSTLIETNPFGLVPAYVYEENNLNFSRFTIPSWYGPLEENYEHLKEQVRNGRKIDEGIYLRKLPIAIQRRGYNATLLSKAKAISSVAKLFNDEKLKQVAIDQLEWILGKNPFASSTMYGEGHNYHPLYVAYSPQLVGALPVGIQTKGATDKPYWPQMTQAVYKEIWGHTTCKYLWILADIYEMNK